MKETSGNLHGVCTIALTPFTEEGEVDLVGVDALTDHYLSAGIHGITVLGIMGEAHKVSDQERSSVAERYIAAVGGRVPVIVGCSAPATRLVVERAEKAEELGAAAVMVAPPSNQKNLNLVYEYYREISDAVSVPVVVQDEPVSTGVVMPATFLARLINEIPNCRHLKLEEAPTTIKISSLLSLIEAEVGIFGGLGGMYLYEELSRGASGIMTGFAYPEILVETYRLFSAGAQKEAQRYFFEHLPLIRFEAQLGIGGVGIRKEMFKLRSVISSSYVRRPAPALDEQTLVEIKDLVQLLKL